MTWTHIIVGLIGFFLGGTAGALGMALCAIAGRDLEVERHE